MGGCSTYQIRKILHRLYRSASSGTAAARVAARGPLGWI